MGQFDDLLLAEAKSYEDTQWTGTLGPKEITLFSRPLTGADMAAITRAHPDFMRTFSMDGMVDLIIMKARAPNGEKAFDKGNRPMLMKFKTDKIGEIFSALYGNQIAEDDDEKFEARVGNSKTTVGE